MNRLRRNWLLMLDEPRYRGRRGPGAHQHSLMARAVLRIDLRPTAITVDLRPTTITLR